MTTLPMTDTRCILVQLAAVGAEAEIVAGDDRLSDQERSTLLALSEDVYRLLVQHAAGRVPAEDLDAIGEEGDTIAIGRVSGVTT